MDDKNIVEKGVKKVLSDDPCTNFLIEYAGDEGDFTIEFHQPDHHPHPVYNVASMSEEMDLKERITTSVDMNIISEGNIYVTFEQKENSTVEEHIEAIKQITSAVDYNYTNIEETDMREFS